MTMKILVIEDNPGDVRIIREMLKAASPDIAVHSAESLESGLRFLAGQDSDVALLDLGLPDSRGLETLKQFQAGAANFPVIVMTSIDDEDTGIEAVRQGAEDYMVKGQIDGKLLRRALLYAIERKRFKENIKLGSLMLDNTADAVFAWDTNGRMRYVNQAAIRCTGYTRKELMAMPFIRLVPGAGVNEVNKGLARLQQGNSVAFECDILREDGSVIAAEVNSTTVEIGAQKLIVSTLRDVSERKKLERLKDDFIGMVSHEMRTPLTTIIGVLNTLSSTTGKISGKEAHQLIEDAAAESEELAHMLENLLELSMTKAKRLSLNLETIDLKKALREITDSMRERTKIHLLSLSVPKALPPVSADPGQLKRILYNLIENAMKYSPEGGNIKVSVRLEGNEVRIHVRDEGKGMSREEQKRIFQPFVRLAASTEAPGIGLGLTVCRELVAMHGGRIWVNSKPGKGSTFCFTLPLYAKPL